MENFYQGETIDFILQGDEVYDFGVEGTQLYKLFIYPNGINTHLDANANLIKTIDSRDTASSISHGDGYVIKEEGHKGHCILPYTQTKNMKPASYSIELLYGDERRDVRIWNTAFTLVSSYSNEIE